jgi:hypothetical protein
MPRFLQVIVPVIGIVMTMSVPLVRYASRERQEQAALDWMTRIHDAQTDVARQAGGFASTLTTLTTPCPGAPRLLPAAVAEELAAIGYAVELRAARQANVTGRGCDGLDLVDDYYLALSPATATGPARQAFASRADGRVYLLYDRVAPLESDIEAGLVTPLDERATFKIP